jgi:dienelactone hydrolase
MFMHTLSWAIIILSAFVSTAIAQQPPVPSTSLQAPPDAPPIKNNPPGPFAVTVEANPGLPTHTIYRPSDLSQFGAKKALPIVSWGNGACANTGTLFQVFLTQVASHGYLAISIGPKDAPLPAWASGNRTAQSTSQAQTPQPQREPEPRQPTASSRDGQLIDAIDWALKENANSASPYYQRLDPNRIAVMGQSCGGLQTLAVSADPRIKTSVIWNSGAFPDGNAVSARLSKATKASLQQLHAPVAYFIGGPSDVAYPNAEDDFKRITKVPVFKANLNVGHGGTFRHPGAGWFGEVGVAWLDWQLKGDQKAAQYFVGADCTLCTNAIWKVEKKGME